MADIVIPGEVLECRCQRCGRSEPNGATYVHASRMTDGGWAFRAGGGDRPSGWDPSPSSYTREQDMRSGLCPECTSKRREILASAGFTT